MKLIQALHHAREEAEAPRLSLLTIAIAWEQAMWYLWLLYYLWHSGVCVSCPFFMPFFANTRSISVTLVPLLFLPFYSSLFKLPGQYGSYSVAQ